jgi:single-strand DNA-binding protein
VSFSIAVNKRIKPQNANEPDADFFRIKAWNQTAEYVSNYLTKGRLVAVDGRLETSKYTDNTGTNREVVEIVADNVNGLDRPRDDDGGGNARPSGGRPAASSVAPSADEYDPFADQ